MKRSIAPILLAVAVTAVACDTASEPTTTTTEEATTTTVEESTTTTAGETRTVLSGEEDFAEGFTVPAGEVWAFDPDANTTVTVGANVVVEGRLEMQPSSGDIEHVLVFEGVDEDAFQGGGMEPIASDVGLWVVGEGQLMIEGEEKTAWAYEYDPAWEGDEVLAAPNSPGEYEDFAEVSETPPPNELGYPTELLNLTRNVRIEGTPDGYTHVFLRSNQPQTIRYAALRYVGPRFGDTDTTGRYGMHFHLAGEGMRGTIVEGVVIRDTGNHAFVPHGSHGITFQDTIAYEVDNEAYWWDEPPVPPDDPDYDPINDTNDIVWDRAVAAKVSEGFAGSRFRLGAFFLANGQNLTLTNSVAIAVEGDEETERSGFVWSESTGDVWTFENNIAHNNESNGIFVWQNTSLRHDVDDFTAYYNAAAGVNHGAYGNSYQYTDLTLLENGQAVISHALGEETDGADAQTWTNIQSNGGVLVIEEHETDGEAPVRFIDCDFSSVVVVDEEGGAPSDYEFVRCGLEPEDFDLEEAMSESVFRVQRGDGTAYELRGDGTVAEIESFYSD